MKKVSVDIILDNYAVCEDFEGNLLNINLKDFPREAKEGDILNIGEKGITIDKKSTIIRRQKIIELQDEIFNK